MAYKLADGFSVRKENNRLIFYRTATEVTTVEYDLNTGLFSKQFAPHLYFRDNPSFFRLDKGWFDPSSREVLTAINKTERPIENSPVPTELLLAKTLYICMTTKVYRSIQSVMLAIDQLATMGMEFSYWGYFQKEYSYDRFWLPLALLSDAQRRILITKDFVDFRILLYGREAPSSFDLISSLNFFTVAKQYKGAQYYNNDALLELEVLVRDCSNNGIPEEYYHVWFPIVLHKGLYNYYSSTIMMALISSMAYKLGVKLSPNMDIIRTLKNLRNKTEELKRQEEAAAVKATYEKFAPIFEIADFDDDLFIKIPKTLDDLADEGNQQKNCVEGYASRITIGECGVPENLLFFVRKKSAPEKSYLTGHFTFGYSEEAPNPEIELTAGSLLGAHNTSIEIEDYLNFFRKYYSYISSEIKTIQSTAPIVPVTSLIRLNDHDEEEEEEDYDEEE